MTTILAPEPSISDGEIQEPITPIMPSEAIRLGRLKRPRVIANSYLHPDGQGACTLSAMLIGFGMDVENLVLSRISVRNIFRYMFPDMPVYVRDNIKSIPIKMDIRAANFESPEEIEASFIRALKAMGY
jgi:hypothetical protein